MTATSPKEKNSPIVYVPEKVSKLRYWTETIISLILTVIMWVVLLLYIYYRLFTPENIGRTIDIFEFLLIAAAVILIIGGGWQFYNWFLFHGKDRRQAFPRQSQDVVGSLYGISGEDLTKLQNIQRAAVVRHKDGRYYYCIEGQEPIEITTLREN